MKSTSHGIDAVMLLFTVLAFMTFFNLTSAEFADVDRAETSAGWFMLVVACPYFAVRLLIAWLSYSRA